MEYQQQSMGKLLDKFQMIMLKYKNINYQVFTQTLRWTKTNERENKKQ